MKISEYGEFAEKRFRISQRTHVLPVQTVSDTICMSIGKVKSRTGFSNYDIGTGTLTSGKSPCTVVVCMEEESGDRPSCYAAEEYLKKKKQEVDLEHFNTKSLNLPLARIKRLMRVEEDANHIASEVLFLYSKVTEAFIEVLTIKAWKSTEADGRRIIQFIDLARAIKSTDTYDFLLYILASN